VSAPIRSLLVLALSAFVLLLVPSVAEARQGGIPQTSGGNPGRAIRPQPTRTGHEIGAEMRFPVDPTLFTPRFRYRYIIHQTAAQGPLSGFWFEFAGGPSFPYSVHDVFGNFAFNVGYEFDPFRNLALTFSPTVQNDWYFFTPGWNYTHTLGAVVRLYVSGHWVFFVQPAAFGFVVRSNGTADFAAQFGFGFSYKF